MQVDLKENAAALSEAYASVRNGTGLNWALFTYGGKGKENLLVVAGTGDGGLSELKEEFNDGKIMYAFARVIDDNSNLPKFVLISWVGGGVPENKKGLVNTHINEIKKLLVGFHVQINARSETDVEPANIQQKVRDASGAKFSVQQKNEKPAAPAEKPEPVGTRYEKPVIIGRQVPVPQDEPPAKAPAPTPNRLPATVPRAAPAAATYSAPPPAAAVYSAPPPASAPRAAPARPGPPAPVPRAAPVVDNRAQIEAEERRKQEEERRQQEQRERQERERREQQEREQEAAAAAAAAAAASKPATGGSSLTATVIYDYQAAEANELNLNPGDIITGIEQIDEGWWQGYDPAGNFGLFPSSYVQANEGDVAAAEPVAAYEEEQTVNTGGQGITARSIYDYQAGDDNELSFDVNEIITEIEMIDEGWWRGRNQAGAFGLFPANYVEQI